MNDDLLKIREKADEGKVDEALNEALQLAKTNPRSVETWLLCAELAGKLQRLSDAINYNQYVLEIDPDNKTAQVNIEMLNSILGFRYKDMYNP